MIQVYKIIHAIDEAYRKNLPNGTLYVNKGAPSEIIQKEMPPEFEEQLLSTACN